MRVRRKGVSSRLQNIVCVDDDETNGTRECRVPIYVCVCSYLWLCVCVGGDACTQRPREKFFADASDDR